MRAGTIGSTTRVTPSTTRPAAQPQVGPGGGDWFYPHTVSRFEFGFLHAYSTNPADFHFHSPYQVQAEFLADVAELSRPQMPTVTVQTARARGNAILSGAFVNGTAYRIGDPRPW